MREFGRFIQLTARLSRKLQKGDIDFPMMRVRQQVFSKLTPKQKSLAKKLMEELKSETLRALEYSLNRPPR
jgi:hypothetical protein